MSVKIPLAASKKVGQPNFSSLDVSCGLTIETDLGVLGDEARLVQLIREGYGHIFRSIEEQILLRAVPGTYNSHYTDSPRPEMPFAGHTHPEPVATSIASTVAPAGPIVDPVKPLVPPWEPTGTFGQAADVPDPTPGPKPTPSPSMKRPEVKPSLGLWLKGKVTDYGISLSHLISPMYRHYVPTGTDTDIRAMGLAIVNVCCDPADWERTLDAILTSDGPIESE